MESILKKSNFTDPIILKFIDSYNWISLAKNTKRYIKLKESTIEVFLSLDNNRSSSRPPLEILFRDKEDNLIGAFTYYLIMSAVKTECDVIRAECLFLNDFGTTRSYMTPSVAIEKLMEYNDIKEWLLWNHP